MPRPWASRLWLFAGLWDKPQVRGIAETLGISTNETIGALYRVWLRFQEYGTDDGVLEGKSPEWVDLVAAQPGLASAMAGVGWLTIGIGRLVVPGFHDFISNKATKRIENAIRMAVTRDEQEAGRADKALDKSDGKAHIKTHRHTYSHKVPPVEPVPDKPKVNKAEQDRLFQAFWSAYPWKTAKVAARKAWLKVDATDELVTQMLAALAQQELKRKGARDGEFVPGPCHPATWLNGRRWEDEHPGPVGPVLSGTRVQPKPGEFGKLRVIRSDESTPTPVLPPPRERSLFE